MLDKNAVLNRYRYLIVLIIVTLAFIWGNSILSADASAEISDSLREFICSFTGLSETEGGPDGYLRKFAHIIEFACLGTEVILLIRFNTKKHISSAILFGLTAALIDETIQLYSEGRGSQVKDIWIDMLGFFIGTFITLAVLKYVRETKCEKLSDVELFAAKEVDKSGK